MTDPLRRFLPIFLLLFIALPAYSQPTLADWYWQNPLPQGNDLQSVWGRSSTEVYAIGGERTLLQWDGVSWSGDYRPWSQPIYDMWGLDNGVLIAVGYGGMVLRYDGVYWSEILTDFDDWLTSVIAFSETDIYVAETFPGNKIRHYDGVDWTLIGTVPSGIHELGGSGPNDIYAVGFEGMMTHYDGSLWTPILGFPNIDLTSVWSFAADDVFVLQQGSVLYHFDGLDWTQVGTDATPSFRSDMWGSSASDLWFVDAAGGISQFDGLDVTEYEAPSDGLLGVWGDDMGNVHAAGAHGSLLTYDGNAWTPHSTSATYDKLNTVWGLSPDDLYAVGSLEVVLHFDGADWTKIHPTMFNVAFNDVWASAADDVFAVGSRGVRHFDGIDWTAMDDGLRHLNLTHDGIFGFGPDDIVSVTEWGAIVRYDGTDWNVVRDPDPGQGNLRGVWGAAPDDIWAVGPPSQFLHWDGLAWDSVPVSTVGLQKDIIGWASDDIYALGNGGELYHYDGVDWTQKDDLVGLGVVAIHGPSSSDLYAVSGFGYVWHFDGENLTHMDTRARTGLTDIWTFANNDIFVVGQGGSVLFGGVPSSPVPEFTAGRRLNLRSEPNPFNPSTKLSFEMPRAGRAALVIHDASGRKIATLIDGEVGAGWNTVRWDGRDSAGRRQASGVYFASVHTDFGREVQKVTLVK